MDHDKALADFYKAIEINPSFANAYHNKAIQVKRTAEAYKN